MKFSIKLYPGVFVVFCCFSLSLTGQVIKPSPYLLSTQIDTSDLFPVQKAWAYSFIGQYQKALETYDLDLETRTLAGELQRPLTEEEITFFETFQPRNAVEDIISRAASEQIVIINEAHHNPRHRVFVQSLLSGLYNEGFRYLGLEALTPNFSDASKLGYDTLLNERGYPLNSQFTGYYTREPQFAHLIREAVALGFTIVAYERTPFQEVERDSAEADNVLRILEQDPAAKILLYCGYAHLVERVAEDRAANYGKTKWLGAILRERSGIDPLTINQELLTERFRIPNSPYYARIKARESSVLVNDQNSPFNGPEGVDKFDLLVYHPPTKYKAGRPGWLYRNGRFKKVKIPKKAFKELAYPFLIKAYYQVEGVLAVPADILEVQHSDQSPYYLVLPPGEYLLEAIDYQGTKKQLSLVIK